MWTVQNAPTTVDVQAAGQTSYSKTHTSPNVTTTPPAISSSGAIAHSRSPAPGGLRGPAGPTRGVEHEQRSDPQRCPAVQAAGCHRDVQPRVVRRRRIPIRSTRSWHSSRDERDRMIHPFRRNGGQQERAGWVDGDGADERAQRGGRALAVTVSRAGATAGRSMLRPVRSSKGLPFVRGRVDELAATGREAEPIAPAPRRGGREPARGTGDRTRARPRAGRAAPVSVSRRSMEHQVVERVARETLDERQTTRMVETILANPEFEAALHRVLSSPALRDALSRSRRSSYADQVVANLRQRRHAPTSAASGTRAPGHTDAARPARPERGPRQPRHRVRDRPGARERRSSSSAARSVGLASSAVGGFHPQWLAVALAGVSALLLQDGLLRRLLVTRGPDARHAPARPAVARPGAAAGRASAARCCAWSDLARDRAVLSRVRSRARRRAAPRTAGAASQAPSSPTTRRRHGRSGGTGFDAVPTASR